MDFLQSHLCNIIQSYHPGFTNSIKIILINIYFYKLRIQFMIIMVLNLEFNFINPPNITI